MLYIYIYIYIYISVERYILEVEMKTIPKNISYLITKYVGLRHRSQIRSN